MNTDGVDSVKSIVMATARDSEIMEIGMFVVKRGSAFFWFQINGFGYFNQKANASLLLIADLDRQSHGVSTSSRDEKVSNLKAVSCCQLSSNLLLTDVKHHGMLCLNAPMTKLVITLFCRA